jgi:hypothetical protein
MSACRPRESSLWVDDGLSVFLLLSLGRIHMGYLCIFHGVPGLCENYGMRWGIVELLKYLPQE